MKEYSLCSDYLEWYNADLNRIVFVLNELQISRSIRHYHSYFVAGAPIPPDAPLVPIRPFSLSLPFPPVAFFLFAIQLDVVHIPPAPPSFTPFPPFPPFPPIPALTPLPTVKTNPNVTTITMDRILLLSLHTEPISMLAKENLVLIFYQSLFFQTIPLRHHVTDLRITNMLKTTSDIYRESNISVGERSLTSIV